MNDKNNLPVVVGNTEENIPYLLGKEAFKEVLKSSIEDKNPTTKMTLMDDVDIVFEYLYLDIATNHPTKAGLEVTLEENDRDFFKEGWDEEQGKYLAELEKDMKEKGRYSTFGRERSFGRSFRNYRYTSGYTYTEPKRLYDRFDKIEESTKKIVFSSETSELFWKVFQAAGGKEIMFYGELNQSEENPDIYEVSGINFPPQLNYGGFVETSDGDYEKWIFDEIILKGKRVPLHVHTHPDFSAFSSSVDERQIKQYITDNIGNPFVIQLIVSNPKKGNYFVRWFDLQNNTWEKPEVEFTYEKIDIESEFPGIFQFTAPPRYTRSTSSRIRDYKSNAKKDSKDSKNDSFNYWWEDDYDEDDPYWWEDKYGTGYGRNSRWFDDYKYKKPSTKDSEEDYPDLTDPDAFNEYFEKKIKTVKIK